MLDRLSQLSAGGTEETLTFHQQGKQDAQPQAARGRTCCLHGNRRPPDQIGPTGLTAGPRITPGGKGEPARDREETGRRWREAREEEWGLNWRPTYFVRERMDGVIFLEDEKFETDN